MYNNTPDFVVTFSSPPPPHLSLCEDTEGMRGVFILSLSTGDMGPMLGKVGFLSLSPAIILRGDGDGLDPAKLYGPGEMRFSLCY